MFALLEAQNPNNPCLKPCPAILKPICAKKPNGEQQTYSHTCVMDYVNCEARRDGEIREYFMEKKYLQIFIEFY